MKTQRGSAYIEYLVLAAGVVALSLAFYQQHLQADSGMLRTQLKEAFKGACQQITNGPMGHAPCVE